MKTSVLINNYNNGPYLQECVESVLAQSPRADEVVVYDDGSSDDSLAILRSFGSQIILIEGQRTPAGSRAAQANAVYQAFLRSTGDLIFLLDGDDRFRPGKIATYTAAFQKAPGTVLVQAPLQQIDVRGAPLGDNYEPMKHKDDYLRATYRLHDVDFYYPTSALAFSRAFLQAVLPLDFSDGIELPVDTRLGIVAPLFGGIVTLTSPYSDWRRHPRAYTANAGRTGQLTETLKRTRVFNKFCRARGHRRIHVLRNTRFYLQLLRAITPEPVYKFYFQYLRTPAPKLPSIQSSP